VFVVSVWEGQYREDLILNITSFVVMFWEVQYTEELILNVTVVVMRVWGRKKKRGTDTECYCVGCERVGSAI